MKIIFACLASILVLKANGQEIRSFLEKSIFELDNIESFEYVEVSQATAAFDTTEFVSKYLEKVLGVRDDKDSIKGYKFVIYWNDTSKISAVYDFNYQAGFNWYDKSVIVTDYRLYPERRKRSYTPFYINARTMFDFALNGGQAELQVRQNNDDTLVVDLLFKRNRYEFQGKIVNKQSRDGYAWSTYTVWFNKETHLPFKILRKNEYQKSMREIIECQINTESDLKINALKSIPDDFTIYEYPKKRRKMVDLTGTVAPDFKLLSAENDTVSLTDFPGKVILLEFTSVSCGPCHMAIPDLIELNKKFRNKNFVLLSIEAYLYNKTDIFKRYVTKNDIDYLFLTGNAKTKDLYKVPAVPYFLIIDQKGIIKKTVVGFEKNKTLMELNKTINTLIH